MHSDDAAFISDLQATKFVMPAEFEWFSAVEIASYCPPVYRKLKRDTIRGHRVFSRDANPNSECSIIRRRHVFDGRLWRRAFIRVVVVLLQGFSVYTYLRMQEA